MNPLYRIVWNELTRSFAAVAETARARGKRNASRCDAGGGARVSADGRPPTSMVRPLALEQRFILDGAAVVDTAHALLGVSAPEQMRTVDPSRNGSFSLVV